MYRIEITEPAKRDLQETVDYITRELKNPQAAVELLNLVEQTINSLTDMPMRHALVGIDDFAEKGVRYIPVGNYLAFYIVKESDRKVSVIRFLYGRRDWMNLLNRENDLS